MEKMIMTVVIALPVSAMVLACIYYEMTSREMKRLEHELRRVEDKLDVLRGKWRDSDAPREI
mgnify:FL=1